MITENMIAYRGRLRIEDDLTPELETLIQKENDGIKPKKIYTAIRMHIEGEVYEKVWCLTTTGYVSKTEPLPPHRLKENYLGGLSDINRRKLRDPTGNKRLKPITTGHAQEKRI